MGAQLLEACLDGYHGRGGVRWLGLGSASKEEKLKAKS
jgi:hypothetical protein